jgi:hypothetical protein
MRRDLIREVGLAPSGEPGSPSRSGTASAYGNADRPSSDAARGAAGLTVRTSPARTIGAGATT